MDVFEMLTVFVGVLMCLPLVVGAIIVGIRIGWVNRHKQSLLYLLLVLGVLILWWQNRVKCRIIGEDEYCHGGIWRLMGSAAPCAAVLTAAEDRSITGGIKIMIIADASAAAKYEANIESFACYAELHGYAMSVVGISETCLEAAKALNAEDGVFFFMRHCVVHEHMLAEPETGWFLMLDADNAVVNANHRLEDYIDTSKDVIHSLRAYSNEIVAGAYIVRNTAWGRAYLKAWSELIPQRSATHGYGGMNADNGALHWLLLHRLACPATPGYDDCLATAHVDHGQNHGGDFVRCFHQVLARTGCEGMDWNHISFVPTTANNKVFFRDGYASNFQWSDSSFIMHAMKNPPILGGWLMPRVRCDNFQNRTDEHRVGETMLQSVLKTKHEKRLRHNCLPSSPGSPCYYDDPSSCVLKS